MIVQEKDNRNDKTLILGMREAIQLMYQIQNAIQGAENSKHKEYAFTLDVDYDRGATSNPGKLEIAVVNDEE